MILRLDTKAGILRFHSLFPHIDKKSLVFAALRTHVEGCTHRGLPSHRRLDGRRARAAYAVRKGDFSLTLKVSGQHYEYAVRRALNLINELFLLLHETYPDYLVEHFGLSTD